MKEYNFNKNDLAIIGDRYGFPLGYAIKDKKCEPKKCGDKSN